MLRIITFINQMQSVAAFMFLLEHLLYRVQQLQLCYNQENTKPVNEQSPNSHYTNYYIR